MAALQVLYSVCGICRQQGKLSSCILWRSWEGLRGLQAYEPHLMTVYVGIYSQAIPCLLSGAWNLNGDTEKSQWDHRKHMAEASRLSNHVVVSVPCWLHFSVTLLLWLCVNS